MEGWEPKDAYRWLHTQEVNVCRGWNRKKPIANDPTMSGSSVSRGSIRVFKPSLQALRLAKKWESRLGKRCAIVWSETELDAKWHQSWTPSGGRRRPDSQARLGVCFGVRFRVRTGRIGRSTETLEIRRGIVKLLWNQLNS